VLFRGADVDELAISFSDDAENYRWVFKYDSPIDDVLGVLSEPASDLKSALFGRDFHYLIAERIGPRQLHQMSSYEVEQQHQVGKDGRFTVAYLEANSGNPVATGIRHSGAAENNVLSNVVAWLGEISPGVQLFVRPYPELSQMTLRIGFEDNQVSTSPFTSVNVGFGLSYVLPVIVAAIASPPGTILMVENPEAHLNPKGQVAVGRLLSKAAASGLQIILETHSDHVLNGIRLSVKTLQIPADDVAIHYFDHHVRDGQFEHFAQSPHVNSAGRLDFWPKGFFDQWEQSLDSLLE
jgi:predicted ATPase